MKSFKDECPYCGLKQESDLLYSCSDSSAFVYLDCGHEAHFKDGKTIIKDSKTKEVIN